jgi:predicted O-methyltransferase YrrM
MKILVYLVFTLPLIMTTYDGSLCNSKNPDYESCLAKEEGFTYDWFTYNIHIWKKHLAKFVNKPNLNFLEIGTHEGRSAIWLIENVLTHATSNITCIDPWIEWKNANGEIIFTRFSNNIKSYLEKINIVRDFSTNALRKYQPVPTFDVIYIDGCHTAPCAFEDIIMSFPLLKPGGVLIIDDYMWGIHLPLHERPQLAVDSFMKIFKTKIDVLHKDYQVIIKKKEV